MFPEPVPTAAAAAAALGRARCERSPTACTHIDQVGHLKLILRRMRMLGVTRPGQAAAGLSEDFALETRDVPERPGRGEPCRDLPGEIMTQLCDGLDTLTNRRCGRRLSC